MKYEYIASINNGNDFYKFQTKGEVCFLGRSNVGKSTLINAVTKQKIAFVSKTPGKTVSINIYKSGSYTIADTPGYGFAKNSSMAQSWGKLMQDYLESRENLKMAYILIDMRRGIMDVDIDAIILLDQSSVRYAIVYTKVDKLSQSEIERTMETDKMMLQTLRLGYLVDENSFILTSGSKKFGIRELTGNINKVLKFEK